MKKQEYNLSAYNKNLLQKIIINIWCWSDRIDLVYNNSIDNSQFEMLKK